MVDVLINSVVMVRFCIELNLCLLFIDLVGCYWFVSVVALLSSCVCGCCVVLDICVFIVFALVF